MNTTQHHVSRPTWVLALLLAALGCSTAMAASKAVVLDPKLLYQRESAACRSIRSFDDRANCLSEASTRFAGTQPTPATEHADILKRNALMRCEPLPELQRKDCMARMQGQGTTRGSVEGGGIYRELVTREVGLPPPAAPTPASAAAP